MASLCIAILIYTFINVMNTEVSANVPDGYKFSVSNDYHTRVRTTYYVYEDKILVEDEGFNDDSVDRTVKIYDDINTDLLQLDVEDTIEICEYGSCSQVPKVLVTIKQLLSRKVGREYIGL
ncbi:hypothetical protein IKG10_00480 [Candidatus Saccharibacteria bacterium]|nr:hypothetical protein [Candidatus Saccharibacteria bacterium]